MELSTSCAEILGTHRSYCVGLFSDLLTPTAGAFLIMESRAERYFKAVVAQGLTLW